VLSWANDDSKDALYLARLLAAHVDQLRRWQPEDPATVRLRHLVTHRRAVVDERTALTNRLQALLKSYFPQALELCGEDLWRPLALAFLRRWPSLQALRKARLETLRSFYYQHGSRSQKLIAKRLELIQNAVALSEEAALIESFALRVQMVVRQLQAIGPVLAQYDRQIAQVFAAHPDGPIFASLPGGSRKCPPQPWAAAYYEQQRAKGCRLHTAVRALAYKWQRILWRCWQDRRPYCEQTYLAALVRARSPLAHKLTPPPNSNGQ
jgi:hypothetical protein